ncbi:MAG: deoxyribodipyrimidine photo-lyase [Phycisphaerales bacterium JB040]
MRTLVWFRADLRTHDNPALQAAAKAASRDHSGGCLAVFHIAPEQWKSHDDAPIKIDLFRRTLKRLSTDLAERNIALKLVESPTFEDAPRLLLDLAKEHACDKLFFNRQYELNERVRDEGVLDAFQDAGLEAESFLDRIMFEPGDLRTGEGNYYSVFSPFFRAWQKAVLDDTDRLEPVKLPDTQAAMVSKPDPIPDAFPGYQDEPLLLDPADDFDPDTLWPAGEHAAADRLHAFCKHSLADYKEQRDFPARDHTSVLSPYLHVGAVSMRQCVHAALEAQGGAALKKRLQHHWISELVWREFYQHILVGYTRVNKHRAFRTETEALTWNRDDDALEAWKEGRTGVPIVDAGMRQLRRTGWMHNRVRMIVAMFLTKNLFQDWRVGERFFMRHLIDGDLGSNNGGWQWSASTGTDAAPYFRIMNPVSQSKRYDPEGDYIRRYVPQLADIDGPEVHEPDTLPGLLRSQLDYPEPLVDLKQSRPDAIDAFKALKD